jgi:hypothetical protein
MQRNPTVTRRATESLKFKVNYGSKSDSKNCLLIYVDFPKGAQKPQVEVLEG